jgi:hypothetical protein
MDPSSAPRILGVHLSPLGDFSHQLKVCRRKADAFAEKTLLSHHHCFGHKDLPPIHLNPLHAIQISLSLSLSMKKHLTQSNQKSYNYAYSPQSTNINPPWTNHLPKRHGSLRSWNQSWNRVHQVHAKSNIYTSEAGKLIRTHIQYSQVESGITQPLLEYPDIHLKGLTSTWITSNRQYLHCHNLTITLTEKHVIQLKGKDNPIIMTAAHLQQYSPQQQKDINLVRLHLQVHTLADIRDPQRPNATLLHMLDGKRNPNTPISKLWPRRQPRAHQHPAATSLEALHVILIHPIHPILETKSNTHWTPLSHTSCQQTHSHPITLCHQPHSTSTTLQTPTPGLLNPSVYR